MMHYHSFYLQVSNDKETELEEKNSIGTNANVLKHFVKINVSDQMFVEVYYLHFIVDRVANKRYQQLAQHFS